MVTMTRSAPLSRALMFYVGLSKAPPRDAIEAALARHAPDSAPAGSVAASAGLGSAANGTIFAEALPTAFA